MNKHLFVIGIVITFLLVGCNRADSVDTDRFFDHYFQLLVSEGLYKEYEPQRNRTELLQAVSFFDSITESEPFLTARAHYMNGIGYFEMDSVVMACAEYMKALNIMEDYFDEDELEEDEARFIALTNTRLTEVFSEQYLHEQAIYFAKRSLPFYQQQASSSGNLAWVYNEIGSHYEMMDNNDSASYYYHYALSSLNDTSCLMYRIVASHLTFINYKNEKNAGDAIMRLRQLLSKSENNLEYSSRCSMIGEIFYNEKQYDSARVYLNDVFLNSRSIPIKKQVAEWLVDISKMQGLEQDSHLYSDFLVPFVNQEENKSEIKTKLTTSFNAYNQGRLDRQHKKSSKRGRNVTLIIVSSLLVTILLISFINHKNKKKKRYFETKLEDEQQSHEVSQKAMGGRLKQSNDALRINRIEKEELQEKLKIQQYQVAWGSINDFLKEDICQKIFGMLEGKFIKREAKFDENPELRLSNAQLSQLEVAVEKHFPGFTQMLTSRYSKIKPVTLYQCYLYLMNLEDAQIAALLHCDYTTIKKRSAKMKQAFGTEKTLQLFIRELVFHHSI